MPQTFNVKLPISTHQSSLWALLILLAGLALSGYSFQTTAQHLRGNATQQFNAHVQDIEDSIYEQFNQTLYGLRGAIGMQASLTAANQKMRRNHFQAYVKAHELSAEFPGVRGFGYIERIKRDDIALFEAAQRADDAPDFAVKTKGQAHNLYVIKYVEPLADNLAALGFDLCSDPVRCEAVERAIRTGAPTLSEHITLVQDGRQGASFLYLLPVFTPPTTTINTPESLQARLLGIFDSPLVMDDLLLKSTQAGQGMVDFEVFDSLEASSETLVFSSQKMTNAHTGIVQPTPFATERALHKTSTMLIGGRLLTLRTGSNAMFDAKLDHQTPWLVLLYGVALSFLMAAIVWMLLVRRARVESLAQTMTQDLNRLVEVKKIAQQTLVAERVRLDNIIVGTNAGTWEWNVQTREVRLNERWCTMLGYSPQELEPVNWQTWSDRCHPDDLPRALQLLTCHIEGQSNYYDCEFRMRHRDGHWVWIHSRGKISTWSADGKPEWISGTQLDISEKKQAEAQILHTSTMLQSVLDAASEVAIITTGLNHQINLFNVGAQRMLGYSAAEVVGRFGTDLFIDQQELQMRATALSAELNCVVAHNEVTTHAGVLGKKTEWTYVRKDGSRFMAALVVTPLSDAHGARTGYLSISHDISTEKDYENWLRTAMQGAEAATLAKSQFLANMSHEIRTPMNAILGMLKLLHNTELTPRQLDYTSKTERAAKSLLGLLNDILDFSKIDAGKMELDLRAFRMDHLMRDLSVILATNVGKKPVEVLFDIDPAMPKALMGDSLRLQQVLINLSSNAIKFTEQGEVVIQIKLLAPPELAVTLRFSVRDSGIGITPANQQHIFEGFAQAEASTTRRFGGTGLGLSISKRLVTLMGGELHCNSALGQGSDFHFTLTLPVEEQVFDEFEQPIERLSAPLSVLVVDDHPSARDVLKTMAESWGWQVDVAASGLEAINMIEARMKNGQPPYETIFVDWQMPGMDGWETILRMRQIDASSNAPITVMVTAHGREMLSRRTAREQARLNAFLVKPITASMLFDAVAEARASRSNPYPRISTKPEQHRRLNGMRLLVVEDNLINQQVAQELLQAEGAVVEIATNGRLGVDALASATTPFDAVLMDIQMPVMDGYTATRAIRHELGLTHLPIVAMTANAMASDRAACLAVGMDDHVGKPFDLPDLIEVLNRLTNRASTTSKVLVFEAAPALNTATPAQAALPTADSVDVVQALARLGGDKALYLRILQAYSVEIAHMPDQIQARLQANDFAGAAAILHTLKGLSATVGAGYLAALAKQFEGFAKNATPTSSNGDWLEQLRAAVLLTGHTVGQVAHGLVAAAAGPKPKDASSNSATSVDVPRVLATLRELHDLLKSSNMHALDVHTQLHQHLNETLLETFEPLNQAVVAFDFAQGVVQCQALIQKFSSSLR